MAVGSTAVVHFAAVKSVIHSFAPLEFPSLLVDRRPPFIFRNHASLCTLSSVPSSILISSHYLLEYSNLFIFFFLFLFRNLFQGTKAKTWIFLPICVTYRIDL